MTATKFVEIYWVGDLAPEERVVILPDGTRVVRSNIGSVIDDLRTLGVPDEVIERNLRKIRIGTGVRIEVPEETR